MAHRPADGPDTSAPESCETRTTNDMRVMMTAEAGAVAISESKAPAAGPLRVNVFDGAGRLVLLRERRASLKQVAKLASPIESEVCSVPLP
jgi:hypothetical protein